MAEIGRTVQQNGISAANQARQWIVRALEQFEVPLIRYALLFVHDVDTARDVVQDTFLKLCREDESDVAPHLNQWLYRVTRNRAIDVARKEKRMKHSSAAESILDRDSGPAEVVQQNEANQNLLARISMLPQRQQEIIRLKFQSGFSYQQIAEVMELSTSNVGVLLHTAVTKLRQQITNEENS